jgi:hypothetical protein
MTFQAQAPKPGKAQKLKILCAPEDDAHRIYVWPTWLPEYLRRYLDEEGEAYPVTVDLEELDRQMAASGVTYEKRESIDGSVEIDAEGNAAVVLTLWLARMFESGTQSVLSG